jgi:hypothetical protein
MNAFQRESDLDQSLRRNLRNKGKRNGGEASDSIPNLRSLTSMVNK